MSLPVTFDHCVVKVTDWERSNAFYAEVLGAEVVPAGLGFKYRWSNAQLNLHGPGLDPTPLAGVPVPPGGSDLCWTWDGPIAAAAAHLDRCGVVVELGPVTRTGLKGTGTSLYFRDPDGSLLEFISYAG